MCKFPRLALLPLVALVAVACVAPPAAARRKRCPPGHRQRPAEIPVEHRRRVAANVMVGPGDEPHPTSPGPAAARLPVRRLPATGVEFEDA